jgi:hypothetical protein
MKLQASKGKNGNLSYRISIGRDVIKILGWNVDDELYLSIVDLGSYNGVLKGVFIRPEVSSRGGVQD